MNKTLFHISEMDCPAEERLVRIKLADDPKIIHLEFDLVKRTLVVTHHHEAAVVLRQLSTLKLGETLTGTSTTDEKPGETGGLEKEKDLLRIVLIINAAFFLIELLAGWLGKSVGLVADSLDMLADAFVYGLALIVVGKSAMAKRKVALTSGSIQLTLAVSGLAEVLRRTIFPAATPDFKTMIIVSVLALLANAICLYLLQKSRSKEVHIQASLIFTSTDVIINAGVILSGVLVLFTQSAIPDLVIGSIVFLLVIRGAIRILRL